MSKINDAKTILNALHVMPKQQNTICCYVLLAMAGLIEKNSWKNSTNEWVRIHDVIAFLNSNYGTTYAENSRETFRKQAMHHFRNAAFIEDNGKATNSPNYRYRLTDEMLNLLQNFGTEKWETKLTSFQEHHETLVQLYTSKRIKRKMPVKINDKNLTVSPTPQFIEEKITSDSSKGVIVLDSTQKGKNNSSTSNKRKSKKQ